MSSFSFPLLFLLISFQLSSVSDTGITFSQFGASYFTHVMYTNCQIHNFTATQKKGQELFRRPLYSYVFWGAEFEFKFKIAPYSTSFGHNLKKRNFRVYDGKDWHHYVRSVILLKIPQHKLKTKLFKQHFSGLNWIIMYFEALNLIRKSN